MTEIAIRPLGEREFVVEVKDGGRQTEQRVTAPERLGGGLELSEHDLSEVVRQSFEFLLEREPASSILPQFSLDDISRYFPESAWPTAVPRSSARATGGSLPSTRTRRPRPTAAAAVQAWRPRRRRRGGGAKDAAAELWVQH
jgi:hypothetical protein